MPRSKATVAERLASGEITEAEALELTRQAALRVLDAAPQSVAGLRTRLERRGFPGAEVERVLERLADVGLLDDAGYAAALVRARHAERGAAPQVIAQELLRKGVSSDDAEAALGQLNPESVEQACAQVAARALRRCVDAPAPARYRRSVSAVMRRGYPCDQAHRVVRQAMAHAAADE